MTYDQRIILDPITIYLELNGKQTQYVSVTWKYAGSSQREKMDGGTGMVITDPTVATVDLSGTVTAVGVGTTTLTVTRNGVSVTAPVIVTLY